MRAQKTMLWPAMAYHPTCCLTTYLPTHLPAYLPTYLHTYVLRYADEEVVYAASVDASFRLYCSVTPHELQRASYSASHAANLLPFRHHRHPSEAFSVVFFLKIIVEPGLGRSLKRSAGISRGTLPCLSCCSVYALPPLSTGLATVGVSCA